MAFLEYRPTQTVYKYCSSDGFLGIVKSKRLWFSDLASANDPREIKLGYDHFMEALEAVRQENYKGELAAFLSTLAEHVTRVHTNQRLFCCCFSLVRDELPMWNAYGENYSGLAIGFRPTSLFKVPCRIQKVRYLRENTIEEFKGIVFDLATKFDALGHGADELSYWIPAGTSALAAMTALKHATWSYEQEVRLVYAQKKESPDPKEGAQSPPISQWPDGKPIKWTKPLERMSGGSAIEYLEFPFGQFRDGEYLHRRAINSIMLGPKCAFRQSDVISIMQENGFEDFEVVASVCQIR
ncbi:MAG TPA: DUF2971 domain-containing protein [Xanthobacteraceae bacterium]|jgi:hypothetical protein|nr:DUF2971 domain-containing protein [Xanthobacteraceae bacterium]